MAASSQIQHHDVNASSIVERIYSSDISYEKGDFRYSENAGTLSSPFNPHSREPSPHCLLSVSDKNVKALEPEAVLKLVIPGKDGRSIVDTSSKYPYCIISQLRMGFPGDGPNQYWSGSGTMVGPHHVLTCAHNVFNTSKKAWAEWVEVYPAKKGENAPFGKGEVTKVYVFEDWTDKGDTSFDIALLILKQSIGNLTGWGGITCTEEEALTNAEVHITGYPGDKSPCEMWTMSHNIQKVYDETFEYIIDTYPGQSGSPVWAKNWENPTILGVHTSGGSTANYGVRISRKKFNDLIAFFIEKNYKIAKKITSVEEIDTSCNYQLVTKHQDTQEDLFLCVSTADGRFQGFMKGKDIANSYWVTARKASDLANVCSEWHFEKKDDNYYIKIEPKARELFLSAHTGSIDKRHSDSQWVHARVKDKWVISKAISESVWKITSTSDEKFHIILQHEKQRFLSVHMYNGDEKKKGGPCKRKVIGLYAHVRDNDSWVREWAPSCSKWEIRQVS